MFIKFFKIFPIIKRKESGLDVKYVYLLPNIEFIIWQIKSLQFGSSKLLSALEGKHTHGYTVNFNTAVEKSGFLSIDGRNKLIPYTTKEIKKRPISGLWVYNDILTPNCKRKLTNNKFVRKACLNYQVWSHCFKFINSLKKLDNNLETASKSGSSILLCIFFKSLIKPLF